MEWTKESLIEFEKDIAEEFNKGNIRAPIHLSGGNEDYLIRYFKESFQPGDWVFTTWRSHYHCLLAGVPPKEVRAAIIAGRSITLCFPVYRVVSSAIVGGHLPISLGVALAIKRSGDIMTKVHAFCGDMAARTGIYREVSEYAYHHQLPLRIITEDNSKSVCTNTYEVWGGSSKFMLEERYYYDLPWPHSGAGKRVNF
jgi:TPP-dependent pyruvate/acetoin dehydrogenase alpha subunit